MVLTSALYCLEVWALLVSLVPVSYGAGWVEYLATEF